MIAQIEKIQMNVTTNFSMQHVQLVRALASLIHNKLKNENASGAGTDAQKDARPF